MQKLRIIIYRLAELICLVSCKLRPILKKTTCRVSFYGLSSEFLRAIERVFTDYRASFYGLSSEFLRAGMTVFTSRATCRESHDNREPSGAVAFKKDKQPEVIIPLRSVIYIIICFMCCACGGYDKSIKRGNAAMALGEYAEAAGQYKKAYSRIPPKEKAVRGKVAYQLGDAYRRYGNVARAVGAFRNAQRYHYTDTFTLLHLGDLLSAQGDYKGAEKAYTAYLDSFPESPEALRGLLSCQSANDLKQKGSAYTVSLFSLFNGSRSDYSPAYMGNDAQQLYFTSTRQQAAGDVSGITAMKNGDIFFSKKDEKGKWKAVEALEGDVNTDYDEGACSFTPDGKTMYLTVCRTDPQYPRMAEIWTSQRTDAKWSKPEQLKITGDTLSSYAHPAPSPDGKWLYFTSDMPGGQGGLDIWRVEITGKHGVGVLENLGPDINTSGNECFPTVRPNGDLYFSSNGRTDNLGGLDFYCAKEDTVSQRWSVSHLPYPMNSNGDDFGITFEGLHNRGFFSSSRSTGGRGWDKIYAFSYPEVLQTVKGWVYEQDGYELPEAVVYMVGSDGTNEKVSVLSDGSFEKPLKPGVSYLFLATCKNYLNVRNELKADTAEIEKQHVLQFPLPGIGFPVLVRNVFYEFDKADLTANSCEALDRLTNMLKENPHVTIELAAHCDYRGNDQYNLNLSQRRAESVVKYLTEHGIAADRLTAVGYGEQMPKIVNKKLTETYPFLHEGDTLTIPYILKLPLDQQEVCNALNRRTEFRVLRTTYGLFDEHGNFRPEALKRDD